MANFRIYNEILCPDLWDTAQHLLPEVRSNLLRMAYDFYEKTKFLAPILDVYLMGSIANYNWTDDSDVDVHVIIDYNQLQMPMETAFEAVKTAGVQWNLKHEVVIKGHKVEINLQNVAEPKPYVTGIYSLTKDQWVRKPCRYIPNLDKNIIRNQFSAMRNYIRASLNSNDRETMKAAKKYLDAYRQYGLDNYGELSYENIVFKILRSHGLIKKLKDSITTAYDQKMSVAEIGEKDVKQHLPDLEIDTEHQRKLDSKGRYKLRMLTMDELKALREKALRIWSYYQQHNIPERVEWAVGEFKKYNAELRRRINYINKPVMESYDDPSYAVGEDFINRRDTELVNLAMSLKQSRGKGKVPWKLVPAALLKKVWLQYGKLGHIDEEGLNKIADQILTNIARLRASTEMMGHSSRDVRPELEDMGFKFTDRQWDEWMSNYFTDNQGQWRLSDYGLPKLESLYGEIYSAETAEDKLYAIDKALNIIHQRSDLAAMFVEGGSTTLRKIFEQGGFASAEDTEKRRSSWTEGYGAGIPETDRLRIKNSDGSTRRWQIRSKDVPSQKHPFSGLDKEGIDSPDEIPPVI